LAYIQVLRCRIVSEKLPKIPLFGPSLIHQLRRLGSQQHPEIGALLTSFLTWGSENNLAEKYLDITGGFNGCNISGVKNWQTLAALWANALPCNKKNLESRTQLDAPASGGDPLLLYKILHLLFFPLVRNLCAIRLENRKIYQRGLDAGRLECQSLRSRECLTNPFRTLSLCFWVIGKTPGLISCNNFVK
jgi:hypothetical protein